MTTAKHFPCSSVIPLSEANLKKHTIQSPISHNAKLKHILMYLDHQRALIAFDRAVDELAATTSKSDHTRINAPVLQKRQHPIRKSSLQNFQPIVDAIREHQPRHQRSQPWLSPLQRLDQHPRDEGDPETSMSGALDPTLALPRALPRSTLFSEDSASPRGDSLHSGIGLREPLQPEDRSVGVSKNCRPRRKTFEQASLGTKQGEQYRPRFDEDRLVQYRRVYGDDFEDRCSDNPPPTGQPAARASTVKVKKTARLGRFSFLKGRQSLPVPPKNPQESVVVQDAPSRSQSAASLVRSGVEIGEDMRQASSSQPGEVCTRRPSKARQLFLDVFKLSSKPNIYVESLKAGSPLKQHIEFNEEPVAAAKVSRELPAHPSSPQSEHVQNVHDHPQPPQRNFDGPGELDKDSNSVDGASAKQTSLMPPPASFVIRHSSSYNDIYSSKHGSLAYTKTLDDYSTVGPVSLLLEKSNEIRNLTVALGDPGRRGSLSPQRRFVAVAPEQKADLEDVGHRHQNTFGIPVAVV